MNNYILEKGLTLSKTIDTTREGINILEKLITKAKANKNKHLHNEYDDGLYKLCIGEHSDMSGLGFCFERFGGNLEVLEGIVEILKNQLAAFNAEYESL